MDAAECLVFFFALMTCIMSIFSMPCKSPIDVSGPSGVKIENFNGSRVEFSHLEDSITSHSHFRIDFTTEGTSGLILLAGDTSTGEANSVEDSDFVSVFLSDGHLRYLLKCGNGMSLQTHGISVNDGRWHKLEFKRKSTRGYISVELDDNNVFREGFMRPCKDFTKAFLGGIPREIHVKTINDEVSKVMHKSLDGCLRHFRVDNDRVSSSPLYKAVSVCTDK